MFPSLNRRHLFKQIFTREESDTGQKRQYTDTNSIVARIIVLIVETNFFSTFFRIALAAYTSKDDYCKQLEAG